MMVYKCAVKHVMKNSVHCHKLRPNRKYSFLPCQSEISGTNPHINLPVYEEK